MATSGGSANEKRRKKITMPGGMVALVGAGPGDPDLLSVRALKKIRESEVILYDALIGERITQMFPRGTLAIYCGKRCDQHAMTQEEIQKTLVRWARKGKKVVRLKGGDPFVFGRGSEEALALAAANIPFEVIPGISSLASIGGLNGIPLTHRGLSKQVMVVEGHTLLSDPPNWESWARFDGTLVIFMGKRNLPLIALQLRFHLKAAGLPLDRPVALIETDEEGKQVSTVGTLDAWADGLLRPKTSGPGIVYIGSVVGLRQAIVRPATEHAEGGQHAAHLS